MHKQQIFPFHISLGAYNRPEEFFDALVSKCFRELENVGQLTRSIRYSANEFIQRETDKFYFNLVKDFFEDIQSSEQRIIFILDDFDESTKFFEQDKAFLGRLRQISNKGQCTLLIISRSSISDIEKQYEIDSILAGICEEAYVGMFHEFEVENFFQHLYSAGIKLSETDLEHIEKHCGRHPYLLDKIAYETVARFRTHGKFEIEAVIRKSERTFYQEFDGIISHLRIKGLFEPLKKALIGSSKHVPRMALIELEDYGLIQPSGNHNYQAFSQHFEDYFRREVIPPNELLTDMERQVLYCLQDGLQNNEIARKLGSKINTIKTHNKHINQKLGAYNRHEAVALAYELGVFNESDPD